jgi:hypothetical protein
MCQHWLKKLLQDINNLEKFYTDYENAAIVISIATNQIYTDTRRLLEQSNEKIIENILKIIRHLRAQDSS